MSEEENRKEIKRICPTCSQRISFPEGSPPKLCYHCGNYLSKLKRNCLFSLTNLGVLSAVVSTVIAFVSIKASTKEARKAEEAAELASETVEALIDPLVSSLCVELEKFVDVYGSMPADKDQYESQVDAQLIVLERLLNNIESLASKVGIGKLSQFPIGNVDLMKYYFDQSALVYKPLNNKKLNRRVLRVFSRAGNLSK